MTWWTCNSHWKFSSVFLPMLRRAIPNICQDSLLTCHGTEVHLLQMRQSRNHTHPKYKHTHYLIFESSDSWTSCALSCNESQVNMLNMDISLSMQSRPCLHFSSVSRKWSQMRWILNQEPWCMRNLSNEGWPFFLYECVSVVVMQTRTGHES